MNAASIVVQGTVTPDGNLMVDQKVLLPAGRVQITIQPVPKAKSGNKNWWQRLQEGRAVLESRGTDFRSQEEIEAEREAFRGDIAVISSRTPERTPNRCPLCGAMICVEPTEPPGDAPCPHCGTLLWFNKSPNGLLFFDDAEVRPISDKLMEIIADNLGVNKENIGQDQSFVEDLGIDSLDNLELVMEIEESLSVTIPDEDAAKLNTIRDLVDYILRRGL